MTNRLNTRVVHFVAEGRYHQQILDTSGAEPRIVAGYSYPHPPRFGQVEGIGEFRTEERSRCYIRNHRHHSVVNGVCLDCLRSRGHR